MEKGNQNLMKSRGFLFCVNCSEKLENLIDCKKSNMLGVNKYKLVRTNLALGTLIL